MLTPSIVYVGLQKTGSAFLRSYFDAHPEIHWTRNAVDFQLTQFDSKQYLAKFSQEIEEECHVDMYEGVAVGYIFKGIDSWDSSVALRPGSVFTGNQMYPDPGAVAERIYSAIPDAKILLTLRNQVSWLRSNYLHYMRQLPPGRRSPLDFLSTFEGKMILHAANFHEAIQIYQRRFGRDNVCVMLMEQIERDEDHALRKLCEFFEVDFVPFRSATRNVNAGMGVAQGRLIYAYSKLGISDSIAKRLSRMFGLRSSAVLRFFERDVFKKDAIAMVESMYAASNFMTSQLIDVDLKEYGYPL